LFGLFVSDFSDNVRFRESAPKSAVVGFRRVVSQNKIRTGRNLIWINQWSRGASNAHRSLVFNFAQVWGRHDWLAVNTDPPIRKVDHLTRQAHHSLDPEIFIWWRCFHNNRVPPLGFSAVVSLHVCHNHFLWLYGGAHRLRLLHKPLLLLAPCGSKHGDHHDGRCSSHHISERQR